MIDGLTLSPLATFTGESFVTGDFISDFGEVTGDLTSSGITHGGTAPDSRRWDMM